MFTQSDQKVRNAYIKKFAGWYIQKEGQFVRVQQKLDDLGLPGDILDGDVNLQLLETELKYFINIPTIRNGEFFTAYSGGFVSELQTGEDTYLEKLNAKKKCLSLFSILD